MWVSAPCGPNIWQCPSAGQVVLGDPGRPLIPTVPRWQLGETGFWILGLVDSVFSVKLSRMFLRISEMVVIREKKMNFFFQSAVGVFAFEKLQDKNSVFCLGVSSE